MFTVDKYQQVSLSWHLKIVVKLLWLYPKKVDFCFRFGDSIVIFRISIMISLQIGFFPNERAFSLRYQTAGMLETVLRQGVLGEDDIGEESPKSVSLLFERNWCLYLILFGAWVAVQFDRISM